MFALVDASIHARPLSLSSSSCPCATGNVLGSDLENTDIDAVHVGKDEGEDEEEEEGGEKEKAGCCPAQTSSDDMSTLSLSRSSLTWP